MTVLYEPKYIEDKLIQKKFLKSMSNSTIKYLDAVVNCHNPTYPYFDLRTVNPAFTIEIKKNTLEAIGGEGGRAGYKLWRNFDGK